MHSRIDGRSGCGTKKVATIALLMIMVHAADAATYTASTTGAQVVQDMLADPVVTLNAVKRERMMGYLDGVMDATVGIAWCPARKAVPHEMNYLVTEEISKLNADALKGNAVPLVTAALRKMFPCVAGSKS